MLGQEELIRAATVVMNALEKELGQTLGFGVLERSSHEPCVEVLADVEGSSGFSFHMNPGLRIPLHTSAPGKAILASLPEKDRDQIIGRMSFEVYTGNTIRTPEAFREELRQVRKQGFAIDRNEQVINCHCVGVPVNFAEESTVGAMWVTGPADSLPEKAFPDIARSLAGGARKIEECLSGIGREMNAEYIDLMIDRAIQLMRATLNRRLDMKQVAADLFVSYSWFRQAFKRRTGKSPNQYHMSLRVEKAKDLLSNPQMLVKDVAEQLGFKDEYYFSARFKRETGKSPRAYRDSLTP